MKRTLIWLVVVLGLLLLAVGGWTVQGARWLLTGSRHSRRRPAWA